MSKSNAYEAWINAGYDLFSQEGYDGIQIERLARMIDLNKSGFYYYFGNRDTFFQHLMQHHLRHADALVEAVGSMDQFVPQYIQLLADFPTPVLVHMQLARENHLSLFAATFADVNKKVGAAVLPLWAAFIETSENPHLAFRYYELFRDMLYARMNKHNLSYEFIHAICMEAKDICHGFKNSYRNDVRITVKSA
jgi:AcrR family transcriptional regulator